MKEIKLKNGYVALVDDEDFEYLNQWVWVLAKNRPNATGYAVRYEWDSLKKGNVCIRMHRVIMKTPKELQVDHIDHNGLNNQKSNLRNCTQSENQSNRRSYGTSKYLGVSRYNFGSLKGWFVAHTRKNGKNIHIGYFQNEEDAARAYDRVVFNIVGEFAKLNFPLD